MTRSRYGDAQSLRLGLIQELITGDAKPYIEIDFQAGGNSASHVGQGWSFQESTHR
jgi:hypothetical protein